MGKIVLAAKITHVPSLLISERDGPLKGTREAPINSLKELGKRARERKVDTFVVFDMHWMSNFGFHINATALQKGSYTSNEAPHMIQNMDYEYRGNPALGDCIARHGQAMGLDILSHQVESLPLEYGTIVPMHYMNHDASMKVISLAANLFATTEQNRQVGEAVRLAVDELDGNVALLASGSMSHQLITASETGDNQWNKMSNEFNRQVDLRVLELWDQGRYGEFVRMLPEYSRICKGEGLMCDTAMMFGAIGWDQYAGKAEQLCEYFPSSGSGQITVDFAV
ncbi:MAG: 3,4-dihydroxyphenylacetate 2,3-dioxygenase [Beijerinckiaceae bacterium]|jgi:3,4-dihydroxyphenylacetate 2,3-dioxygenase|nr:3,4-dihydroxyphenylacetate 2,3-dioxygenase [Beijerinckiaceae bacterium]